MLIADASTVPHPNLYPVFRILAKPYHLQSLPRLRSSTADKFTPFGLQPHQSRI